MSLLDNMPHRCSIYRRSRAAGTLGGSRDTLVPERTGVECWEQQLSASEVADYEKRGIRIARKVYFPSDPNVTERHQIVVTGRVVNGAVVTIVAADQVALDVKAVHRPDASAGLGVCWKVLVDESTGADD